MSKSAGPFHAEVSVPDGTYRGFWGGYDVTMLVEDQVIRFRTEDGVRGMAVPCTVTVRDGVANVVAGQ